MKTIAYFVATIETTIQTRVKMQWKFKKKNKCNAIKTLKIQHALRDIVNNGNQANVD